MSSPMEPKTPQQVLEPYQRLEQRLAIWSGTDHVVCCNSGTAALHLALESLRLPLGSYVLVPDFTFISVARAVTLAGLVPVFVDIGNDLLLNPSLAKDAISYQHSSTTKRRVWGLIAVHTYGRRCDMNRLFELAETYHLAVVEDIAEAHGVHPDVRSDAACWSFYKNKIVAGEEGGAVAFSRYANAQYARSMRSQGYQPEKGRWIHAPRGMNYRMANAQASLILPSLGVLNWSLRDRKVIEGWYNGSIPDEWKMPKRDVCWLYDIRLPGVTASYRDRVVFHLQRAGIDARPGFWPLHLQEEYKDCLCWGGAESVRASGEILCLPVVPGITTQRQVALAVDVIKRTV